MAQYFSREREILFAIREFNDPHLIKPIGSYRYKGETHGSFLFPWAEGGNLRQLWQREKTQQPLKDLTTIRWILQQLRGLCHALKVLHQKNCRHGDVKPENILLFIEEDDVKTLKIADVGLGRLHIVATQQRVDESLITGTKTGTIRYISPKFISDVIPRSSDMWSLGCVFLEYLIWILYGFGQLQDFIAESEQFWQKEKKNEADTKIVTVADAKPNGEVLATVHPRVLWWIDRMTRDLAESETALRSLLEIVKSRMLVVDDSDRSNSEAAYETLTKICERAGKEPGYALDDSLPDRLNMRAQPPKAATSHYLGLPQFGGQQPPTPLRKNTIPQDGNIIIEEPIPDVPNGDLTTSSRRDIERQVSD